MFPSAKSNDRHIFWFFICLNRHCLRANPYTEMWCLLAQQQFCDNVWITASKVEESSSMLRKNRSGEWCVFFLTPLKRRVRFIRGAFRRLRNLSPPFSSIHTFNTSNTPGCWKTNNGRFCSFLHDGQLFPSASEGAASTCITRHITAWCNTLTSSSSSNKFNLS